MASSRLAMSPTLASLEGGQQLAMSSQSRDMSPMAVAEGRQRLDGAGAVSLKVLVDQAWAKAIKSGAVCCDGYIVEDVEEQDGGGPIKVCKQVLWAQFLMLAGWGPYGGLYGALLRAVKPPSISLDWYWLVFTF